MVLMQRHQKKTQTDKRGSLCSRPYSREREQKEAKKQLDLNLNLKRKQNLERNLEMGACPSSSSSESEIIISSKTSPFSSTNINSFSPKNCSSCPTTPTGISHTCKAQTRKLMKELVEELNQLICKSDVSQIQINQRGKVYLILQRIRRSYTQKSCGARDFITKREFEYVSKCYFEAVASGLSKWVDRIISFVLGSSSIASETTRNLCASQAAIFSRIIMKNRKKLATTGYIKFRKNEIGNVSWSAFHLDFINMMELLWQKFDIIT